MCRNYIYSSVKITHIYCYSMTLKMCTSYVQPMYIFAVKAIFWPATFIFVCLCTFGMAVVAQHIANKNQSDS